MSAPTESRGHRLLGMWVGISPRLLPLLAVITAFLAGIPLITLTVSDNALQPDIAEGLRVSSTAYIALVESMTGLTINPVAKSADFADMRVYAGANDITTRRSLSRQARPFERVLEVGMAEARQYAEFFARFDIDEDAAVAISERLETIDEVGAERLRELAPRLDDLSELKRADLRALTEFVTAGQLDEAAALYAPLADMSATQQEQLRDDLALIDERGLVALLRSKNALLQMDALGIAAGSAEADMLAQIVVADFDDVVEAIETLATLDALGIDEPAALGAQFRIVGRMYDAGYLSGDSVNATLDSQLDAALAQHLVIRRPGNRVLNADDMGSADSRHSEK